MAALPFLEAKALIELLESRFVSHQFRHPSVSWSSVIDRLNATPKLLEALSEMEHSGGAPDVTVFESNLERLFFCDFSVESPSGRRSLCYDDAAWAARKENKPRASAVGEAERWGVELLDEEEYRQIQRLGALDAKTSTWLKTPQAMRALGGALFGDFRFGRVFAYHNGAESYYAARGFRAKLPL